MNFKVQLEKSDTTFQVERSGLQVEAGDNEIHVTDQNAKLLQLFVKVVTTYHFQLEKKSQNLQVVHISS